MVSNKHTSLLGLAAWLLVVLGFPTAGFAAVVVLWRPPSLLELTASAVLYTVAGLGVSMGWHRYFTHRSFTARRWLQIALAVAGSIAFEGSLSSWVANHRAHHAHTDAEGDPHSPWTEKTRLAGLFHAHVGWLRLSGAPVERLARDIQRDPTLSRISRCWWLIAIAAVAVPVSAAAVLSGADAAVGMAAWAGVLRISMFHHVTWSVNSLCHISGTRMFDTKDRSTNVAWLSLASFGESWHNNHHAHPASARHGVRRGQLDLTAELLRLFERLGAVSGCRWHQRIDRRIRGPLPPTRSSADTRLADDALTS